MRYHESAVHTRICHKETGQSARTAHKLVDAALRDIDQFTQGYCQEVHRHCYRLAVEVASRNNNVVVRTHGRIGIKFMFQPAEETFEGSKNMIENGILENPPVDAALAYHVSPGKMPIGLFMYNDKDTMMYSVDGFKITIHGKGSHGAYPHVGVDPINIGVHIHLALQELIARESDPTHSCVLTIGQFAGGTAANIIPETVVLQGTIRTNKPEARELLVRRMKEVAEKTAAVYNGTVDIEMISEVPPLICNPKLTDEVVGYMQELGIPGLTPYPGISASASEDFAVIAEKVPSTFMYLSAGYLDERGQYPAHHPKAQFNEDVCPIGAACLAHCASQWLKNNK